MLLAQELKRSNGLSKIVQGDRARGPIRAERTQSLDASIMKQRQFKPVEKVNKTNNCSKTQRTKVKNAIALSLWSSVLSQPVHGPGDPGTNMSDAKRGFEDHCILTESEWYLAVNHFLFHQKAVQMVSRRFIR